MPIYQVVCHKWIALVAAPLGATQWAPAFTSYTIQTQGELSPEVGNRVATYLVHAERCASSSLVRFGRVVFLELSSSEGHTQNTKTFTAVPATFFHPDPFEHRIYGFRNANVLVGMWEHRAFMNRETGRARTFRYLGTVSPDDLKPGYKSHSRPNTFTADPESVFAEFCLPYLQDVLAFLPEVINVLDVDRTGVVKRVEPTDSELIYGYVSRMWDFEMSLRHRQPARTWWDCYSQWADDHVCTNLVRITKFLDSTTWYFAGNQSGEWARYVRDNLYQSASLRALMHYFGYTSDDVTPSPFEADGPSFEEFINLPFGSLGPVKNQPLLTACLTLLHSLRSDMQKGTVSYDFYQPLKFMAGTFYNNETPGTIPGDYEYSQWDNVVGRLWAEYNTVNLITQTTVPQLRRVTLPQAPKIPRVLPSIVNAPGDSFPDVFEVMPYVVLFQPGKPKYIKNEIVDGVATTDETRFAYAGPLPADWNKPQPPLTKADKPAQVAERSRLLTSLPQFVAPGYFNPATPELDVQDPFGLLPDGPLPGSGLVRKIGNYVLDQVKSKAQDWAKEQLGLGF